MWLAIKSAGLDLLPFDPNIAAFRENNMHLKGCSVPISLHIGDEEDDGRLPSPSYLPFLEHHRDQILSAGLSRFLHDTLNTVLPIPACASAN
jgi:hypothetical protein